MRQHLVPAGRTRGRGQATTVHAAAQRGPEAPAAARSARGDSGETLALLVLWPVLLVAILVLLVHAFIVANAQAEAEVAASAGLRAAWRSAANEDFLSALDADGNYRIPAVDYEGEEPHPRVIEMAEAAQDAVARAAATDGGWRWWTPGVAAVQSNWCRPYSLPNPNIPPGQQRPGQGDPGWVRVVVSGEVFGPLAALWPDRLDRVYAAATGPAVITSAQPTGPPQQVPADLPLC